MDSKSKSLPTYCEAEDKSNNHKCPYDFIKGEGENFYRRCVDCYWNKEKR